MEQRRSDNSTLEEEPESLPDGAMSPLFSQQHRRDPTAEAQPSQLCVLEPRSAAAQGVKVFDMRSTSRTASASTRDNDELAVGTSVPVLAATANFVVHAPTRTNAEGEAFTATGKFVPDSGNDEDDNDHDVAVLASASGVFTSSARQEEASSHRSLSYTPLRDSSPFSSTRVVAAAKYGMHSSPSRGANFADVHKRLMDRSSEYTRHLAALQASRIEAEMSECTFAPCTNRKRPLVSPAPQQQQVQVDDVREEQEQSHTTTTTYAAIVESARTADPSSTLRRVGERLHSAKDLYERNRALLAAQREREELAGATFHPRINSNSSAVSQVANSSNNSALQGATGAAAAAAANRSSSFLENVAEWEHNRKSKLMLMRGAWHESEAEKVLRQEEEKECTFKPRINALSAQIAKGTTTTTTTSDGRMQPGTSSSSAHAATNASNFAVTPSVAAGKRLFNQGMQHLEERHKPQRQQRSGSASSVAKRAGSPAGSTFRGSSTSRHGVRATEYSSTAVYGRLVRDNEAREVMRVLQEERLCSGHPAANVRRHGFPMAYYRIDASASCSPSQSPGRHTRHDACVSPRVGKIEISEYSLLLSELNKRKIQQQQQKQQPSENERTNSKDMRAATPRSPRYATPIRKQHHPSSTTDSTPRASHSKPQTRKHQLSVIQTLMEKENNRKAAVERKRDAKAEREQVELEQMQRYNISVNKSPGCGSAVKKKRRTGATATPTLTYSSIQSVATTVSEENNGGATSTGIGYGTPQRLVNNHIYQTQLQWKESLQRTLERRRVEQQVAQEAQLRAQCTFSPKLSTYVSSPQPKN